MNACNLNRPSLQFDIEKLIKKKKVNSVICNNENKVYKLG